MILSNCNNQNTITKNIINPDIFCLTLIVLIIILIYLITRNKNTSKIILIITSLITINFIIIFITTTNNKINLEGCYCKIQTEAIKVKEKSITKNIEKTNNKVIIIGDSRMQLIRDDKNNLEVPINNSFIAKSGAKIDWFKTEAIPQLENKLEKLDKNYNYHIVFNMGVNDLNQKISYNFRAKEYYETYKKIIQKYPKVNFYILSVNPVIENQIKDYWPSNIRTNKKIEKFNAQIIKQINQDNLTNVTYCDSYNKLKFNSYDGLHYNKDTNKDIIKYINTKCIKSPI